MLGGPIIPRAKAVSTSIFTHIRSDLFAGPSTLSIQIRTSTKRGGGTTKNGRDSAGKRLGVKKFTDEYVIPGQIIVRQRGYKINAGQNVGSGKDQTLHALEPGYVKYYTSHLPYPHIPKRASDALKVFPPVNMPRGVKQFVGIVRNKEDRLPREELSQGRDRRFWGWPKERQSAEEQFVQEAVLRGEAAAEAEQPTQAAPAAQ